MDFSALNCLTLGPLRIWRATREELTSRVLETLAAPRSALAVAFCNAHTAERAFADESYAAALDRFVVVNDGIGMEIASHIVDGRGFLENLNGTDFVPGLFDQLDRPTRVYLLGARPGVAEETGRRFAAKFPNFTLAGARDGFFSPQDEAAVVDAIRAARPDILLVALGNPKQELFIARHFDRLGARVMFGVGALFDFTAGQFVRAPAWMRRARLEWAFRLAQEPARLARRYTVDMARFLTIVLRLKLSAAGRQIP
jgi:exopolysaccharide biosynthesis WecB/TagA/CpsF family protein